VHVSIIGGEPLVRYRELCELLPLLDRMGVEVQLVTSAVRPIPEEWSSIPSLHLVVSIDGLASEHDRRRTPATYDRILKHIAPHRIIVHCTVTRPMLARAGYLSDFCRFWSDRPEVHKIWFSIYTPQQGDSSAERLRPDDREKLFEELSATVRFPKVHLPRLVIEGYRNPPRSPEECTFRAADHVSFGRLEDSCDALPTRWKARLRRMRLHGLGWNAWARQFEVGRSGSDLGNF